MMSDFNYGVIEKEIKWIIPVSGETIKQYLKTFSMSIVEGTI